MIFLYCTSSIDNFHRTSHFYQDWKSLQNIEKMYEVKVSSESLVTVRPFQKIVTKLFFPQAFSTPLFRVASPPSVLFKKCWLWVTRLSELIFTGMLTKYQYFIEECENYRENVKSTWSSPKSKLQIENVQVKKHSLAFRFGYVNEASKLLKQG